MRIPCQADERTTAVYADLCIIITKRYGDYYFLGGQKIQFVQQDECKNSEMMSRIQNQDKL